MGTAAEQQAKRGDVSGKVWIGERGSDIEYERKGTRPIVLRRIFTVGQCVFWSHASGRSTIRCPRGLLEGPWGMVAFIQWHT